MLVKQHLRHLLLLLLSLPVCLNHPNNPVELVYRKPMRMILSTTMPITRHATGDRPTKRPQTFIPTSTSIGALKKSHSNTSNSLETTDNLSRQNLVRDIIANHSAEARQEELEQYAKISDDDFTTSFIASTLVTQVASTTTTTTITTPATTTSESSEDNEENEPASPSQTTITELSTTTATTASTTATIVTPPDSVNQAQFQLITPHQRLPYNHHQNRRLTESRSSAQQTSSSSLGVIARAIFLFVILCFM